MSTKKEADEKRMIAKRLAHKILRIPHGIQDASLCEMIDAIIECAVLESSIPKEVTLFRFSPLHIEIMLHIYSCYGKIPNITGESQIICIRQLINMEFIRKIAPDDLYPTMHGMIITDKGKRLIDAWLNTMVE